MLDIPEHLPSSPLCPMHPKHKSGGKGICPYHGRRRDDGDVNGVSAKTGAGGMREGLKRSVNDFRMGAKISPVEIPEQFVEGRSG